MKDHENSNKNYVDKFNNEGFFIIENLIPDKLCKEIHHSLHPLLLEEKIKHGEKYKEGILPLPLLLRPSLIHSIIQPEVIGFADNLLSQESLIYLCMASFVESASANYAILPHRDITFSTPTSPLFIGLFLTLTDFQKSNGATIFYRGSHKCSGASVESFEKFQLEVPTGSAIFFDARIIHNSEFNNSKSSRSCLAIAFCHPAVRPRFDFPRLLPPDIAETLSEYQKKKLGFLSKVPSSFHEYFIKTSNQ